MLRLLACCVLCFVCCACASKVTRENTVRHEFSDSEELAYYSRYSYDGSRYVLREDDRITDAVRSTGSYYIQAYTDKTKGVVTRIDEYENGSLLRSTLYTYDKDAQIQSSVTYNGEEKVLSMEGVYEKGVLIGHKEYSYSGEVYTSNITHIAHKGIKESFYTAQKDLKHVVYYNLLKKPVRFIGYRNGRENVRLSFHYDEKHLLKRKVLESKDHPKRYYVYRYDEKSFLRSIEDYVDRELVRSAQLDKQGRDSYVEYYKDKKLNNYVKVQYDESGKHLLWYNHLNQLIRRQDFDSQNILQDLSYNVQGTLQNALYYTYDKGVLSKAQVFYKEKLRMLTLFNAQGKPVRIERYKENATRDLLIEKQYNDAQQLHHETYKDAAGRLVMQKRFYYDKSARLVIEDVFTEDKPDHKKVYEYNQDAQGNLLPIIKYFRQEQLFKKESFNTRWQIVKREYGSAGNKLETELYKYSKGKLQGIRVLDPYDNVDKTIRIRHSKDQETGLKVMQEDAYDRRDQYLGSVVSYYDIEERLFKKELFNYLQQKTETQHYDPDTATLISQEKYEVH